MSAIPSPRWRGSPRPSPCSRLGAWCAPAPPKRCLSDPEAVPTLGVREAGARVVGRVLRHHADGLTEIAVSAGRLLLPRLPAPPGAAVRVRIEAQDVILALERPDRISALNMLPGVVAALRRGEGPGVVVQLRCGEDLILARITRRSAEALGIAPGVACWAVIKTMAVAQWDIGQVGATDLAFCGTPAADPEG